MKKFLLASVALFAVSASASAADMRLKAPAYTPAAAVYSWSGLYIGGHLGAAFQNNTAFGSNNAGLLGGGQIGLDYQFASWVLGVEAQYSFVANNNNSPFVFPGGNFNSNLRGLFSVTGRLGYAMGPALLYAKGGYAYADVNNTGFGPFAFNDSRNGYTVGGGLEYMFAPSWSGKIEYQYYDFGNRQLLVGAPLLPAGNWNLQEHTVKVGLNYRFNLGSVGR